MITTALFTWKTWTSIEHFHEDAPHAPDIERGCVVSGAQKDIRGPVPQGHHFVRVSVRWNGFGTG